MEPVDIGALFRNENARRLHWGFKELVHDGLGKAHAAGDDALYAEMLARYNRWDDEVAKEEMQRARAQMNKPFSFDALVTTVADAYAALQFKGYNRRNQLPANMVRKVERPNVEKLLRGVFSRLSDRAKYPCVTDGTYFAMLPTEQNVVLGEVLRAALADCIVVYEVEAAAPLPPPPRPRDDRASVRSSGHRARDDRSRGHGGGGGGDAVGSVLGRNLLRELDPYVRPSDSVSSIAEQAGGGRDAMAAAVAALRQRALVGGSNDEDGRVDLSRAVDARSAAGSRHGGTAVAAAAAAALPRPSASVASSVHSAVTRASRQQTPHVLALPPASVSVPAPAREPAREPEPASAPLEAALPGDEGDRAPRRVVVVDDGSAASAAPADGGRHRTRGRDHSRYTASVLTDGDSDSDSGSGSGSGSASGSSRSSSGSRRRSSSSSNHRGSSSSNNHHRSSSHRSGAARHEGSRRDHHDSGRREGSSSHHRRHSGSRHGRDRKH